MFDVAPTELLLVLVVALVVVGPKDLPKAMRFVGKWVGKARGMARHFRSGLDTMMREAELEELEKQWRQQNEDIMRQFPSDAAAAGALGTAAAGPVSNPDFDAATQSPEVSKPGVSKPGVSTGVTDANSPPASPETGAVAPPETHIVPPRGSELP